MPDIVTKDLGPVSGYAVAVEHGFEGTEEEWIQLVLVGTENAQTAAQKAKEAADSSDSASESAATAARMASSAKASADAAADSADAAGADASAAKESADAAKQSAAAAEESEKNAADSEVEAKRVLASIPADYTELSRRALAAYPTDTASGPIASFPDGADDIPVKKLVVNIEPVQDGTGDPSPENVRPIHGWTELHTVRSADFDKNGAAGVEVDFEAKTFKRLDNAAGLSAGADFDGFIPFGGRRRCTVLDNGEITAFFGDDGFVEDGSNGQVMVYQPKFYYRVVPVKLEAQADGVGYHIRKAEYYVSGTPKGGFKLHPAFKDVNGNEVDYILLPAYEGCLYDTSADAYITDDAQVMDAAADKLSSIAGVKPASGATQQLTRPNVENLAQNRGANWHGYTIQAASANQMLMLVELAGNVQTVVGQGVVSIGDSTTTNNSSYTGSTASLGNGTGRAAETINERNGTEYTETADDKTAISYRGMENPWGNIWDFVYGINIHGNGNQKGGIPYICTDFNFAESKNSGNYESAGFTVTNTNGYISAFGYGNEDYDWLFITSETAGTSALPIGDYTYITANLNGYRIALLGGTWYNGTSAGPFDWSLITGVGYLYRYVGGRLVYVPTAGGTTQPLDEWEKDTQTKIYPISFPTEAGTVYGGTLDVTTGELTVTGIVYAFANFENWVWSSPEKAFSTRPPKIVRREIGESATVQGLCELYTPTSRDTIISQDNAFAISTSGATLFIRDSRFDENSINDFVSATRDAKILLPLVTPITYQLTPTEVKTLLGNNNVWADTGDATVEYRADTKLYVDKQIAELQALVLENNG